MRRQPRVLVLAPFFLPGEKGGGQVRAVDYLVQHLRQDFEFVIATSDHDLRDPTPYTESARHATRQRTGFDIRYLPGGRQRWPALRALLAEGFDLVYLNSFLSRGFSLAPLMMRRMSSSRPAPVLLAPRGELMAGAMQHKQLRKKLYLRLLQATGLLDGVHFHATSAEEAVELEGLGLPPAGMAPDLPPRDPPPLVALQPARLGEPLRIIFAARIDPKKNLVAALEALAGVSVPVQFDIVGPVGDTAYWARCQPLLARLPGHVQARYLGAKSHSELQQSLGGYELMLLPTRAENNGYVILEALLAGCAVLISDATPWRGLSALEIGWDLPLDDLAAFTNAVNSYAALTPEERLLRRDKARCYGLTRLGVASDVEASRDLLLRACGV